jgi:hypothetical protein
MMESTIKTNLLLASLARDDYALLRPHLTHIHLDHQAVLQEAERPVEHVFFPLEGMVSVVATPKSGETIEIAAIGREGAVGTKIGRQPQLAIAAARTSCLLTARLSFCRLAGTGWSNATWLQCHGAP